MEYYSTLIFVLITSITPGPNNITSFSFSLAHGYQKTLKYILGIVTGTILILFISGLLVDTILSHIKNIEPFIRIVAAGYIVYLAIKSLNIKYSENTNGLKKPSFLDGLLLQLINPKAILYAISLYSGFLVVLVSNSFYLLFSAILLSTITFITVSFWALSGSILLKYVSNKRVIRWIGVFMFLLLITFAIKIMR